MNRQAGMNFVRIAVGCAGLAVLLCVRLSLGQDAAPTATADVVETPAAPVTANSAVQDPSTPEIFDANAEWGDFLFRLKYQTRGYGEPNGMGVFGVNKTLMFNDFVFFGDAALRMDEDRLRPPSASLGIGTRFLYDSRFSDSQRIFGASFWYDGNHVDGENQADNYFQQVGISLESLGETWDFRANANLPMSNTMFVANPALTGATSFLGHELLAGFTQFKQYAMTEVDAEAARRIGGRNLWAFGGAYCLDGAGETAIGGRGGVRGYLTRDVLASLSIANDRLYNTTVMFNVTWFLDWGARGRAEMAPICIADRFREPVQRNDYVAVLDRTETGTTPVTDAGGTPLYFVHANNNSPAGGDGTYENPHNTLAATESDSSAGDYLFLQHDSVFNAQSITLKNSQSLLGEGIAHSVSGYVFGVAANVTLPDRGGPIPIIQNAPGIAVTLANNNVVSGLVVDGAVDAIALPVGASNASIDHLTVQNITGAGLNFQGNGGTVSVAQYTYDGGTTGASGARFTNFTGTATIGTATISGGTGTGVDVQGGSGNIAFTNTTISNTGGAAVNINGGSTNVTINGQIVQNNAAAAVNVMGGHTGSLNIQPLTVGDDAIVGAGSAGLQFNNANGTYTFGQTALTNGTAGVNIAGASTGTFTFSNATITSPTGTAFSVAGGSADVDFTGHITQANNAAAISVSGGHTGTLDFQPATAGSDVVTATNGTGLQFNNANGTYTVAQSTLNGGAAAVSITGASIGTFTIAGTITNPTASAVTINGGAPTVTLNMAIVNNAAHSVDIENLAGGSVAINGTITDVGTGILVQNNSAGSVAFNGQTTLSTGANNAVALTSNTGAAIAFNNGLIITTTSGTGFLASGGGTLAVTGTSNTIDTTTGVGLNLSGVAIDTTNQMYFKSVSVNGATNGVALSNITGGSVRIGDGGTTAGDGGAMTTTGAAITATNVANLSVKYVSGTSTGTSALTLTSGTANSVVLFDNNEFTNNSAADATVNLLNAAAVALNATMTNNTFENTDVLGANYLATSNNSAAVVALYLNGNTASGGTGSLNLNNIASAASGFEVVDLANLGTNNHGATINQSGTITNIPPPSPIPTPP